ncbi:MAG TPA: ketoacyl-ACP synthase III [Planctomycetes bacterium]|nr:ketoacyl-ACP synthase III [Planctomycetota bacterium]
MNQLRTVGVAGTGHYVPEQVLSNHDLEGMVDTSDEWIFTRTGMRERRIAGKDQACSDLCYEAARKALQDAKMAPEDLQLIVVATVTPDQLLPSTAAFLQEKLGAWNAGGWDINNACTGFLSALSTAYGMIASGSVDNALILGAEVLSRIINYQDRASCILFGDGAGAMVLKADHPRGQIIFNTTGMDGSQWDAIQRSAGGSRRPIDHEVLETKEHLMTLKGNEVFRFAVAKFRSLVTESLEATGHTPRDIGMVVPHQVNIRIIDSAMKKLDIDPERIYVNLDRYGNTSAASIPIAFDEVRGKGLLNEGDLVSFVAFGAGLSWGSALLRW